MSRGSAGPQVVSRPGAVRVVAAAYQLEVRSNPPRAVLADAGGRIWSHLSLLASIDRTDVADVSWDVGEPTVLQADGTVEVRLAARSAAWTWKEVRLRCTSREVSLTAAVEGSGVLAVARVLGGSASLPGGACGEFWSSTEFVSVYSPAPSEPVQVVRPAAAAVTLGVVGDAGAGRLHGIFSPPPLCLALGRRPAGSATDVPDGDWLGMSLRAGIEDSTFTAMRYDAVDGGFRVELDYDGHTRVTGSFCTPALVLRPAASPTAAIEDYREDLVRRGLAPASTSGPVYDWWSEPLFCGWGAQCARAPLPGAPAHHPYHLDELAPAAYAPGTTVGPDLAREDVYDHFLATLAEHGVRPGTVVVDDRWQVSYGGGEPEPDRWPDLRAWVARQHTAGRRVLLWWKAWDPAGVPVEECVLDPSGRPVSVDPGNPAYRERLARTVHRLLGAEGVDADGLKVDFTQRAPSGRHLRCWSDGRDTPAVWGVAGLHVLLGTVTRAAKAARPDALVVTHTPHPGFGDVCDMVRTNDVLERDPGAAVVPVADQLAARVAVVRAALPHHLVDTDQWPMPDRASWRSYVQHQARLGVPALYYVDRMDRSGEPLRAEDLELVARTWADYRARRAPA